MHRPTHTGITTRCRAQRRNPLRLERPQLARRTREVLFIAGCSHFIRKNTRFRAPASSPIQAPCTIYAVITMSPLPKITASLRHDIPSLPLPIVTTSLLHHFPSSPLPLVTTSLRHPILFVIISQSYRTPFVTTSLRYHFPKSPNSLRQPFPKLPHPLSPLPFVTTLCHSPPRVIAYYSFEMY